MSSEHYRSLTVPVTFVKRIFDSVLVETPIDMKLYLFESFFWRRDLFGINYKVPLGASYFSVVSYSLVTWVLLILS